MERQEIGRFSATSFDDKIFDFIVFTDNTIDCPTLNINSIKRIELKPRFVLRCEDSYYVYDAPANRKYTDSKLIAKYDIEDELFKHLKENDMIFYSVDMAYLYGFSDKDGYDKGKYGVGSPYKWAKKKGPILVKQKEGKYN